MAWLRVWRPVLRRILCSLARRHEGVLLFSPVSLAAEHATIIGMRLRRTRELPTASVGDTGIFGPALFRYVGPLLHDGLSKSASAAVTVVPACH